jgi:mannose-6-phosphate isomerase-like protein (cupin superfamily)
MRVIDAGAAAWSIITDVHGAAGVSGWKQLLPGRTLRGPWEAVELARIPAVGVSGVHRHTRTHEVYFILSGHGEFSIDGRVVPMPAGHVAITPTGSSHGLRGIDTTDVTWLVAEVPARSVWERTMNPQPSPSDITPVDLTRVGVLDLTDDIAPLRQVGTRDLAAGERLDLTATDTEVFAYVVTGAAVVTCGATEYPVSADTGVTLSRGERAVVAATEPARLFWVSAGIEP